MIFELLEKIDKKYPFDLAFAHCGFRKLKFKQQMNSAYLFQKESSVFKPTTVNLKATKSR